MNLLYIYSSNINPTHGGVQRVTKVLCDYFRTLGHNCYYLSSQPTNGGIKNQYVLPNTELLNEQNIYYIQSLLKEQKIDVVVNQDGLYKNLTKLVHTSCYGHAKIFTVAHNSLLAPVTSFTIVRYSLFKKFHLAWLLPLLRTSVVKGVMNAMYKKKYKQHYQDILKYSNQFVLLSNAYKKELAFFLPDFPQDKVCAIYNPCTIVCKDDEIIEKKKIVLYVGRISFAQKRNDLLLHVWKNIELQHADWQLKVVGEGEDLPRLKIMAKEMIAMILAGGQGSRLYALTQKLAKPAVPFGGKYRIIDFPLSNCVNSDIDTVGILTQYQPLVLNEYIGNGQPWDLDRLHGGVHVLPPYQQATGSDWYKGTANAIYQNISFIDRYDPQYVIILSGDQICKQDYADFLRFHKEKNAEFSVAVMEVPWSEAPRFGLMVTDENDRISEFQEKPKNPKSNLASMGIYIFNWDILKKYLTEDENDPNSENDFGKNVIPALLRDNRRMYAYRFSGYWKDVGTISSLWQANMEVLDPTHSGINLFDENWKIYSRNSGRPCQRIGTDADIVNSMITEGCQVDGTVKNSILFPGVVVEKGATVEAAVVMGGTVIKAGAKVEHCIVAENVTIEEGATVGKMPESGLNITEPGDVATVGSGVKIGKGATVGPKAMISNDVKDGEEQW
jgi:glucose-1-phosphate adenylyltransferase